MSLIVSQPNLPESVPYCGEHWHHKPNLDIRLLVTPKDQEEPQQTISPRSPTRSESGFPPFSHGLSRSNSITVPSVLAKRSAGAAGLTTESPAKKQSKWSPEEDTKIIQLRGEGMKWEDISKHLPGRSAISCRLHYQNYLERRSEWDEDRKNKLARLYERFKNDMWAKIAEEMQIPWRAAEAMHWQMGEHEMARRAGVTPFTLANVNSNNNLAPSRLQSRQPPTSRSRAGSGPQLGGPQQLPSLAEMTAGLPAYAAPLHGYAYSDRGSGSSPYQNTLPMPRQTITPPPGNLHGSDYFGRR